MDMKRLYQITTQKNILEEYKLPYTFFTDPDKVLDEETCLHEIICILTNTKLHFSKDSSDFGEMIDNKSGESIKYPKMDARPNKVKVPYVTDDSNPLVNLLCFMRAYASHTYHQRGSFRLYFMDVFDVFYNMDLE
jgi:hypothetical protein